MKRIFSSAQELIGHTPLIALERIAAKDGIPACLYAKPEGWNPGGSAKDRVARALLDAAEADGSLAPGGTVIEPTSGNTGVGLAMVGALRGYRVIIVMPDTMSAERRKLMCAYGAELVLTPGKEGMSGAVQKAEALHREIPGSILAGQFDNPANPMAHETSTGPEIWEDTEGQVDIFIAGVGTGGTLTGTGRYLKRQNPRVQIIGVEPAASPLLTGGAAGPHGIEGIGANFIPRNFDPAVCDEIIGVTDENALAAARRLSREEGILAGISSGAALWAALQVAARPENKGKHLVVLLPDSGDRYFSTDLFA